MAAGGCCSCDEGGTRLVFACAGASSVGQLTNRVALALAGDGLASMSCLAGVAAHLSGFVVSAKDCDQLIVLDGCEQRCALKTFEHVGVVPHVYLALTDHGFEKQHGVPLTAAQVERAKLIAVEKMGATACSSS